MKKRGGTNKFFKNIRTYCIICSFSSNCKKDIYQIDLDKIKQNIKKVDASEDEMIIYVDTLVNDYGSSVDECLKYVKQELNYNKSELLGTDDMSNIYLLKR